MWYLLKLKLVTNTHKQTANNLNIYLDLFSLKYTLEESGEKISLGDLMIGKDNIANFWCGPQNSLERSKI